MSFQHAPVTKGVMIACALTSIVVAIFDVKHYFHLQLIPHLSRDLQYWRLFTHHLVYSNSSELFAWELLLFNVGVSVERQYGSIKYASFIIVTSLVSTILEFLCLLVFHTSGFNHIPAGPTAVAFSLVYQYSRIVPSTYRFAVFGVVVTNKIFHYILALQLAVSHPWASTTVSCIGLITGALYRSDIISLKSYRLPPWILRFSSRHLFPLLGDMHAPRRTNRALGDDSAPPTTINLDPEPEAVTTARSPLGATPPVTASRETGTSVMREWVNELTGRTERASRGLRVPSEAEIAQVTSMFPDLQRSVVVGALQRSPTVEGAVETLLSS
ncbi:hypothetical protein OF83DRAFT_735601 [Amylostereum chailletii]|nr:hypothetical protein OF83DRAFT_735601 [Amylostereum chailletii]